MQCNRAGSRLLLGVMLVSVALVSAGCGQQSTGIGSNEPLPDLIAKLKSPDAKVKAQAAEDIRLRGTATTKDAIPHLIANFADESPKVREWSADAVAQYGMDAVPALLEAAKSKDPKQRATVCYAFGGMPSKPKVLTKDEVIPILLDSIEWEDLEVRRMSAYAFNRYAGLARPHLKLLLKKVETENDKQIRCWLMGGIGNMGTDAKEAIPVFEPFLKHEDQQVREVAAKAIYFLRGEKDE